MPVYLNFSLRSERNNVLGKDWCCLRIPEIHKIALRKRKWKSNFVAYLLRFHSLSNVITEFRRIMSIYWITRLEWLNCGVLRWIEVIDQRKCIEEYSNMFEFFFKMSEIIEKVQRFLEFEIMPMQKSLNLIIIK